MTDPHAMDTPFIGAIEHHPITAGPHLGEVGGIVRLHRSVITPDVLSARVGVSRWPDVPMHDARQHANEQRHAQEAVARHVVEWMIGQAGNRGRALDLRYQRPLDAVGDLRRGYPAVSQAPGYPDWVDVAGYNSPWTIDLLHTGQLLTLQPWLPRDAMTIAFMMTTPGGVSAYAPVLAVLTEPMPLGHAYVFARAVDAWLHTNSNPPEGSSQYVALQWACAREATGRVISEHHRESSGSARRPTGRPAAPATVEVADSSEIERYGLGQFLFRPGGENPGLFVHHNIAQMRGSRTIEDPDELGAANVVADLIDALETIAGNVRGNSQPTTPRERRIRQVHGITPSEVHMEAEDGRRLSYEEVMAELDSVLGDSSIQGTTQHRPPTHEREPNWGQRITERRDTTN